MDTQRLQAIEMAVPCLYCHKTRARINVEREVARERFPHFEAPVCCSPDSEHRCPDCNSQDLDFAMHYATSEDDETGELAYCNACHWVGAVEDAAPPVQPWAELEVVALQDPEEWIRRGYTPRMPMAAEDDHEMARRLGYREVA